MTDSLICMKPGESAFPLYLVPSAGTKPLSLIHLTRSIDTPRMIYSFVFAGIEDDQDPHTTIGEMAAAFVDEIREVQPSGPYFVGGHCFGGTVALEIVTQLEALGEQVALLMLMDTFAPLTKSSNPTTDGDSHQSRRSAPEAALQAKQTLDLVYEQSSRQLAMLPPSVAKQYKRILRIQIDAALRHQSAPVNTRIVLFRTRTLSDSIFFGWRTLSPGGFCEFEVLGDTFSMLSPPYVRGLCRQIQEILRDS